MKKSILFICIGLAAIALIAMDYTSSDDSSPEQKEISCTPTQLVNNDYTSVFNWKTESDFFFEIGSRFIATISKEELHNARTVLDIVPWHANWSHHPIKKVNISVLGNNNTWKQAVDMETGYGLGLNPAQLQLLQSTEYANSFCVTAICSNVNPATGVEGNYELVYYISVTPEKEAQYIKGSKALIAYLNANSKEQTTFIEQYKLRPGRLYFTVTKEGNIANTRIEGTSGYEKIDERMVELIMNTKSEWLPAENNKGEKIDQELVLHFGIMGC